MSSRKAAAVMQSDSKRVRLETPNGFESGEVEHPAFYCGSYVNRVSTDYNLRDAVDRLKSAGQLEDFAAVEFAKIAPDCKFTIKGGITDDWAYEMRRQAQPILHYLLLGPATVMKDAMFLRGKSISLVIYLVNSKAPKIVTNTDTVNEEGIELAKITDSHESNLWDFFVTIIRMINENAGQVHDRGGVMGGLPMPGKILVCSNDGNPVAIMAVVAYLIVMLGFDLDKAIGFVQTLRPCVVLNQVQYRTMTAFADIHRAKGNVNGGPETPKGGKRSQPTIKLSKLATDDSTDVKPAVDDSAVGGKGASSALPQFLQELPFAYDSADASSFEKEIEAINDTKMED